MKQGGKILAVDDEPRNIRILEELFEDYTVESASSGEECLQLISRFVPDIVLLDIMMPGLDGYQVCKHIKSSKECACTKVLLVSGKAMVEERLRGYEVGADDYITKPFDIDELAAKVEVFMRLKTLEAMDTIKQNFLRLLAHESRTPLNAVLGFSNMILDDPKMEVSEIRDCVRYIRNSGDDFLRLVTSILRLCDLQGIRRIEREKFCVLTALQTAREIAAHNFQHPQSNLIIQVEPYAITGSRAHIEEGFQSLFEEAIRLGIRRTADIPTVTVTATDESKVLQLDFSCGKVNEAVQLRHIFDTFSIEEVSRYGGMKYPGLAIARTVAELHGGSLEVVESLDDRCTLRMQLGIS